jgi:hypothetical protein
VERARADSVLESYERRKTQLRALRGAHLTGNSPLRLALFACDMRSNTTLDEIAQARPRRGTGAPARSRSHYEAILALLGERGPQGVLGSELYARPELYGRSPRNRISELRRDGHLIEGKPHGSSDWFYRLIRDNIGEKPFADSSDWYQRAHGPRPSGKTAKRAGNLPLFAWVDP